MAANMKERWQTHNMIANNLAKESVLHRICHRSQQAEKQNTYITEKVIANF